MPKAGVEKSGTVVSSSQQKGSSVCVFAAEAGKAEHTSEVRAYAAKSAQDTTPALKNLRGLGDLARGRGLDEVVLRVGVKIRSVRERGRSPDGKLGGVEVITKVATDIGASGNVLGEIGGGLINDLGPEGVGMGDVVGKETEEDITALLGDHAVLQSIDSSGGGVGRGQAVRSDVGGLDGLAQASIHLLGGSSLVCDSE